MLRYIKYKLDLTLLLIKNYFLKFKKKNKKKIKKIKILFLDVTTFQFIKFNHRGTYST